MVDLNEKVLEFLSSHPVLEPGETVMAAAKAMPLGEIKRMAQRQGAMLVGGAVGAIVSHVRDSKAPADDMAAAMKSGVYLALTERRLLLISAAGMRALPSELLASVQRSRIVSVEEGVTKVSFVKMMTLTFAFDDETSLAFEFPKVDIKDARTLLDKVR